MAAASSTLGARRISHTMTPAMATPRKRAIVPIFDMVASHPSATLISIQRYECEGRHTASDQFIGHKTLDPAPSRKPHRQAPTAPQPEAIQQLRPKTRAAYRRPKIRQYRTVRIYPATSRASSMAGSFTRLRSNTSIGKSSTSNASKLSPSGTTTKRKRTEAARDLCRAASCSQCRPEHRSVP